MSEIERKKTNRGFGLIKFQDSNGEPCSLQISSSAMDSKIWLGLNEVTPKRFIPNEGWIDITLPPNALISGRMHLSRGDVIFLIKELEYWLENDELNTGD